MSWHETNLVIYTSIDVCYRIFLIWIFEGSVLLINNKWVPHQVTISDLDQLFITPRFFDRPLPYLSKEIQNISGFYITCKLDARLNESYHGVSGYNKRTNLKSS